MKKYLKISRKVNLLILCILFAFSSCSSSDEGQIEVEGTIIELSKGNILAKEPNQMVVQYTDKDGNTQIAKRTYELMEVPKVDDKISILYNSTNPSEIVKVDEGSSNNGSGFVTYALFLVSSLILLGSAFGYWMASKKGEDFRFKPLTLILTALLFLVSLYAILTGQDYNDVLPFIQ